MVEIGQDSPMNPLRAWTQQLSREMDVETRLASYYCGADGLDAAAVNLMSKGDIHVISTRYDERSPPTVISLDVEEVSLGYEDISSSVVLDVYGDEGFDSTRDHFFVLEDLSQAREVKLRVQGPGSYSGVPDDSVDSWDAVVSMSTS